MRMSTWAVERAEQNAELANRRLERAAAKAQAARDRATIAARRFAADVKTRDTRGPRDDHERARVHTAPIRLPVR